MLCWLGFGEHAALKRDISVYDQSGCDRSVRDISVYDISVYDISVYDISVYAISVYDRSVYDKLHVCHAHVQKNMGCTRVLRKSSLWRDSAAMLVGILR